MKGEIIKRNLLYMAGYILIPGVLLSLFGQSVGMLFVAPLILVHSGSLLVQAFRIKEHRWEYFLASLLVLIIGMPGCFAMGVFSVGK